MTILSWAEKVKMVIDLYKKHTPTKDIARQLNMSLRDVYAIIREEFGEKKKELTNELKALILFRQGKRPVEVAIKLRITSDEAIQFYIKYKDLIYLGKFGNAYKLVKGQGQLKEVLDICEAMKIEKLTVTDMVNAYHLADDLAEMEDRFLTIAKHIEEYQGIKNTMLSEIDGANTELSSIKSEILVAKAELTRIYQSFNYPNQNNNTNYANLGYPNSNPYYNTGYYNYGNIRYW